MENTQKNCDMCIRKKKM